LLANREQLTLNHAGEPIHDGADRDHWPRDLAPKR
jgi:hypothetical protein